MGLMLAVNVAVAMTGARHAALPHFRPVWHRPGLRSATLAAMAMRGSGALKSGRRAGEQEMLSPAVAVDAGVDGWRWRDGTGRALSFEKLVSETKEARVSRQDVQVHIGCDSAVSQERVTFAIVVCVVSIGHAGRYFYARLEQSLHTVPVLQTRLVREVELALSAAQELTENGVDIVRVHVDSNTAPGCSSTEHTNMLTGYVSAMGFSWLVKPEAWANFVADRHSRGNVHNVRRSALVSSSAPAQKKSASKSKIKKSAPTTRRAKAR